MSLLIHPTKTRRDRKRHHRRATGVSAFLRESFVSLKERRCLKYQGFSKDKPQFEDKSVREYEGVEKERDAFLAAVTSKMELTDLNVQSIEKVPS